MIEVEFHNVSTYHSFSVNNDAGWTMAALSDKGLILATEKNETGPRQVLSSLKRINENVIMYKAINNNY